MTTLHQIYAEYVAYKMLGEEVPVDVIANALEIGVDITDADAMAGFLNLEIERIMEPEGETPVFEVTTIGERVATELSEPESCPECGMVFHYFNTI